MSLAGAGQTVSEDVITAQRAALAANTMGKGFGPQSPRDIDATFGTNDLSFAPAPPYRRMNLCNIHLHSGAEHRGGEFRTYAGPGDGKGYGTGYVYSGEISSLEKTELRYKVGDSKHGSLHPGDTIEVHYVYSTANVALGPTLGACLEDGAPTPRLRVETQVFVLVNLPTAEDFVELTEIGMRDGLHQAVNLPNTSGAPVQYAGSTTGPEYNEADSPFLVTWSVRPNILKLDIKTLHQWFQDNPFEEDHAHGVRNLVTNPALLSGLD